MTEPSTAREALIAEALGDLGRLLDRVEVMAPKLDTSRLELIHTSDELVTKVTAFESRMTDITENAKLQVLKHIARRADEMTQVTLAAQTRAMEDAARTVFRSELSPALQRVALPLQQLAELARRGSQPWEWWLAHAATAAVSAAISWLLAAWLWTR